MYSFRQILIYYLKITLISRLVSNKNKFGSAKKSKIYQGITFNNKLEMVGDLRCKNMCT